MTAKVDPTASMPLGAILPFFLLSPLGMIAAGVILAGADEASFVAINLHTTVAATHALVVGWITTAIMGATLQLSPAVLGGPITAQRTVRLLPWLHGAAIGLFTWSLYEWDINWMGGAGALLVISLATFAVVALKSLARGTSWTTPRVYALTALGFLVATFAFGITVVGALHHLWFPITFGRLAAHAHLGLAGWLALMVMGVSYQLVPMFNIIRERDRKIPLAILGFATGALLLFAGVMLTDPERPVRLATAVVLALAAGAWGVHQGWLLRQRVRRKMGIHGIGTCVALGWLCVAVVLGLGAAGAPWVITVQEPARWPLACGAAFVLGWLGTTLVTNSFKIVPFLIWYHRYRSQIGTAPTPVLDDISGPHDAAIVLTLLSTASALFVVGALTGTLQIFVAAGVVLAATGVAHIAALLRMLTPKTSSRTQFASARKAG